MTTAIPKTSTNGYKAKFRLYGKNGVMEADEPHPDEVGHELGIVIEVMDLRAYTRLGELTGRHFPVLIRHEVDRSALLLISNQP